MKQASLRGTMGIAFGAIVGGVFGAWASYVARSGAGALSEGPGAPEHFFWGYVVWGMAAFGLGGLLLPVSKEPAAGFAVGAIAMSGLAVLVGHLIGVPPGQLWLLGLGGAAGGGWAGVREFPKWGKI